MPQKRPLNTFKLLLTFTKNFEGPLAFMYGYLKFNMSSQSRNSIFLNRKLEKFIFLILLQILK